MGRTFGGKQPHSACNLTPEGRSKGGFASSKKRRAEAMAALEGMTPMQIARAYYIRGWHQGRRTALRKIRVWKVA